MIGYVGLDWSMTETCMFYSAELCAYELVMLPRIVTFVFTSNEYFLDSIFAKIVKSFFWLFFHLFLFSMTIMFLIHTAYAVSADTAYVTIKDIFAFSFNRNNKRFWGVF